MSDRENDQKQKAKERSKLWRLKNKQKHREYSLKYQKEHRIETNLKNNNWTKKNWLKIAYNITEDDYNNMLKDQNECCYICKFHISKLKVKLYVDHNHITNTVRGLLCRNCNMALGTFKVDKEGTKLLKNAINYIQFKDKK